MTDAFPSFDGHQFLRLTTFRRSGEAVPTPVWFAAVDGGLGVFTSADAGKVKRIRRLWAGCGSSPAASGAGPRARSRKRRARLVTGEAGARIEAALAAKYGWQFRMIARRRAEHAFIEIVPAG